MNTLTDFNVIVFPDEEMIHNYLLLNDVDIILLGHSDDHSSTELLKFCKALKPSAPVIILTYSGNEALAVNFFRYGAWDYYKKPFKLEALKESILNVLELKNNKGRRKGSFYKDINGFDRAIGFINENYHIKITLPQVAYEACMSISSFEKKFKSKMDTTFVSYLNELRISKAMDMLNNRELSMWDIAKANGFSNQYHFARTFKKIAMKTPTAYRKSLNK